MYSAAFSQVCITPDFPTELVGCARKDSKVRGVLDDLHVQVLLLKDSGDVFCLIAIDNLGLTVALAKQLREKVANRLGTTIPHVMLNFSHTHSAPCPAPSALNGTRYFDFMTERVLACVDSVAGQFAPCKAGWALTETDIGENRRDGCSIVDKRLGALKIADAQSGRSIAMVLRVTAHANVLMDDSALISSDYIGAARTALSVALGCPIMILQGAAGNIKPVGVNKIRGGAVSDIPPLVDALKRAAQALQFDLHDLRDVRMLSKEIEYRSDVPGPEQARAVSDAAGMDASDWLAECDRLRSANISVQAQMGEMQFLKIDEGCFCGVADEIFCELALETAKQTGNPLLFLNGYTNGCAGYLPTKAEWHKGGYEIFDSYLIFFPFHGHVMPFQDDTAERIIALAVDTWKSMQKSS